MPIIPDKSIDMILADLPFGVTNNKKDIVIPFELLWKEYERIIKDNGAIALYAQGIFYVDLVNSNRKLFRYDLVWNKILTSGFLNANRQPMRIHEQIGIFYKKQPVYNPQYFTGEPLHSKGVKYKEKIAKNRNYGKFDNTDDYRKGKTDKYPTSIVSFQKPHPSKAIHPTQKSIECDEWLIRTFTNEGEIVLDNTMGVGTTCIACKNTNRYYIGIEKEEKWFNIANETLL
jgi:site-specific DNA-methyltransferase (adenine-specific)